MPVALETLIIAHTSYYTPLRYILSRFAPCIPMPEGRGFTALFDKGQIAWNKGRKTNQENS